MTGLGGLCLLALATAAAAATLPRHPAQLAPLTPESVFPRFTAEELAAAGYPDHKHVFAYPGYTPPTDADGQTYGMRSLSRGTAILSRDGLEMLDGVIRYRGVHLRYDPYLEPYEVLPMVEALDWAQRELTTLLAHDPGDTLHVYNTIDLFEFRQRSGYAFHRLYHDDGGTIVIQPLSILFTRGLGAHAAFHMTAGRLVRSLAGGKPLPRWLVDGLSSYLAEDGCHFLSYLAMYRDQQRPVIMAPDAVEAALGAGPDPDDEVDKYRYRVAGYSAFLMAWELVEHRGGLARVRALLTRIGSGEAVDAVCRELYGLDLAGLTAELDPTRRPEPVGEAHQPRAPHAPPSS